MQTEYSHLFYIGHTQKAGRSLCGEPKAPNVVHYPAMLTPESTIDAETTCPKCRWIWGMRPK